MANGLRKFNRIHGAVMNLGLFTASSRQSIVDLCGAAVVLDLLGWPRVISLPPELGRGMAKTAHGMLPVPAPASLEILAGKPIRAGGPPGEAVTPTGAAILATLCEIGEPPTYVPRRIGYGVGTSRWPDRANVLRMTLADLAEGGALETRTGVVQIEANLDDCPGQLVARAIEGALQAGALDAWAAPITMKKGRPAFLLSALRRFGQDRENEPVPFFVRFRAQFSSIRRIAAGLMSHATTYAARAARVIAKGPTPANISRTVSRSPIAERMRCRSDESRAEKYTVERSMVKRWPYSIISVRVVGRPAMISNSRVRYSPETPLVAQRTV